MAGSPEPRHEVRSSWAPSNDVAMREYDAWELISGSQKRSHSHRLDDDDKYEQRIKVYISPPPPPILIAASFSKDLQVELAQILPSENKPPNKIQIESTHVIEQAKTKQNNTTRRGWVCGSGISGMRLSSPPLRQIGSSTQRSSSHFGAALAGYKSSTQSSAVQ